MDLHKLRQSVSWLVVLCFYARLQLVATSASAAGTEADVSRKQRSVAYQPGFQALSRKPKVMGAINQYRAKICADMKDEHGVKFKSYEACDKFMRKACHPGSDLRMDGDRREITSGEGYCKNFFNGPKDGGDKDEDVVDKEVREAVKVVDKEVKTDLGKAKDVLGKAKRTMGRDQEESSSRGDDEEGRKDDTPKPKAQREAGHRGNHVERSSAATIPSGVAPAPSPAGGPGGAPGPAAYRPTMGDTVKILSTANTKDVFPEGIGKNFVVEVDRHNGKPYRVEGSSAWLYEGDVQLTKKKVIGPDEKWYYKNGGIDQGRFHMDEDLKLPAQGYWGKLVEHEDMETSVGDWQHEFGRATDLAAQQRKICETHPENVWCQRYVEAMDAEEENGRSKAPASIFDHPPKPVLVGVYFGGLVLALIGCWNAALCI